MNRHMKPNSLSARDVTYMAHPQTNFALHEIAGPRIITHSEGVFVIDEDGESFLEGSSGLWCSSLGFASERLATAAYNQMSKLGAYHTFRHNSNEPSILLCEKLIELAPVPMSKVMLQCSGSEANDTAIKLSWYYQAARGKPEKRKIIGRDRAYHGTTCAAISASGKREMHRNFQLPFEMFRHTDFPHYYRNQYEGETEEEFATRMAQSLDDLIIREGPDTVAAFFAEPVMGGGGAVMPPKTYFAKIQAVLKKHDVLFVVDEVICGFGRTGRMWGTETFELHPDMISCAKALSAGMIPISALMISQDIYEAMRAQSEIFGAFQHGYTYSGHPVSAAVALETLKIYEEMDVVAHTSRVGAHLQNQLKYLLNAPYVGDVAGVGLIGGIELVAAKESREPLDQIKGIPATVERNCRKHGLVLRFVGDRIAIAPPFIITEPEIDELFKRLRAALDDTFAEIGV